MYTAVVTAVQLLLKGLQRETYWSPSCCVHVPLCSTVQKERHMVPTVVYLTVLSNGAMVQYFILGIS